MTVRIPIDSLVTNTPLVNNMMHTADKEVGNKNGMFDTKEEVDYFMNLVKKNKDKLEKEGVAVNYILTGDSLSNCEITGYAININKTKGKDRGEIRYDLVDDYLVKTLYSNGERLEFDYTDSENIKAQKFCNNKSVQSYSVVDNKLISKRKSLIQFIKTPIVDFFKDESLKNMLDVNI